MIYKNKTNLFNKIISEILILLHPEKNINAIKNFKRVKCIEKKKIQISKYLKEEKTNRRCNLKEHVNNLGPF